MIIIYVVTKLSDCVRAVLLRGDVDTTLERMSGRYSSMIMLYDRDSGDIIPRRIFPKLSESST